MKIAVGFALLIFITLPFRGHSYEVDNFTMRYSNLAPADQALDKQVNQAFAEVVKRANEDKIGCSQSDPNDKRTKDGHRTFRSYLREAVAPGNVIGVFEESVEGSGSWLSSIVDTVTFKQRERIPKHSVKLENSIYGGNVQNKMVLSSFGINSSIKLGGEYIGSDKLGHFFDQGFEYYKRWTLNGSEQDALRIGRSAEESTFGKMTTGVKSYADLAANYSGFQFWRKATEGNDPYFRCSKGVWTQVKDFRWSDYVNPAWDEAINCNDYASKELEQSIQKNIASLEEASRKAGLYRPYQCPVDAGACAQLSRVYNSKYFVSPKCRKHVQSYNYTSDSSQGSQAGGAK